MVKLLGFIFISFTILVGCNFESSEEESGGGLFNDNKSVENSFIVIPPTNKTYLSGDKVTLTLRHPFNIDITGTPSVDLEFDSGNVAATYVSGSGSKNLRFSYTVTNGDNDTNGLELGDSLNLNSGSATFRSAGKIIDANLNFSSPVTPTVKIDTSVPQINAVIPVTPLTYLVGQQLSFNVNFSETVIVSGIPRLQLTIGSNTVHADYSSGSNSNNLVFNYIVTSSDIDYDGIEMQTPLVVTGGASIKDISGNNINQSLTPIPMPTTFVDGDIPYVTTITPPVDNTYYCLLYTSPSPRD